MKNVEKTKIIMACDRTGGHVYPAQVLAEHIAKFQDKSDIIFCGLRADDELRLKELGYEVYETKLSKRRHIIIELVIGFYEAIKIIYKYRPSCIVGFGGRASLFLLILGRLFSKTLLYEPNAVYGRSNKLLSCFSNKIFLGLKDEQNDKEIKVGVPVRFDVEALKGKEKELKRDLGLDDGKKTVLIFGGSSGARAINASVRAMFEKGLFDERWQLVHITGTSEYGAHKEFYASYDDYTIVCKGYSTEIEKYYAVADVVVSRSGASSVAELEYLAKPVVFIPYPFAYGHQFDNARTLTDSKGIQIIDQKFLDEKMLWTTINEVYSNSGSITRTKFAWVDAESFAIKLYAEIKN